MYPWEAFAVRFGDTELTSTGAVVEWFELARRCPATRLGVRIATGVTRTMTLWIAREQARASALFAARLVDELISLLTTPHGYPAAKLLVAGRRTAFPATLEAAVTAHIEALMPEVDESVQHIFFVDWIDGPAAGTLPIQTGIPTQRSTLSSDAILAITDDLGLLAEALRSDQPSVVELAIVRMIDLDHLGIDVLVDGMLADPPLRFGAMIANSVEVWSPDHWPTAAALVDDSSRLSTEPRYLLAVGLYAADRREERLQSVSRFLLLPCEVSWITLRDAKKLQELIPQKGRLELFLQWSLSPHPRIYEVAISLLIENVQRTDCQERLVEFLRLGTGRDQRLREKAAAALWSVGNLIGFPLMLIAAMREKVERPFGKSLGTLPNELEIIAVSSMLAAGPAWVDEANAFAIARSDLSTGPGPGIEIFMEEATSDAVRRAAAGQLEPGVGRADNLKRVADVFSHGVQLGHQLTGRLFKIERIGGDAMGYTRLTEDRLYINPMPVLKGLPGGNDIVEGLILHELGHHLYHRGTLGNAIWGRADQAGLGRLLNLVADEHLERNLRALDATYGNQLKRLGAYAFNRGATDFAVDGLIASLGSATFSVLSEHPPMVSRDDACVRIDGGSTLQSLERRGLSFAHFFRALRLGLGNRHDDPKVAEALALFGKSFRHQTMKGLYRITRKLRRIFADDAQLIQWLHQDTLCRDGEADLDVAAAGISNDELWKEVMRVTSPPRAGNKKSGSRGALVINVGEDISFDTIDQVVRMSYDAEAHRAMSPQVARSARQFRWFINDLGVSLVPVARRTLGRRLDQSRLTRLILHHDPRVLITRRKQWKNDLFLGVVIDCSGSMYVDDNVEAAKLFGTMMADASRRLFHPIENRFIEIGDNVQFIAAVNRGGEFSATYGIDAAQLDRFAPLQMDYPPPDEEIKLLQARHPEVSKALIRRIVELAGKVRTSRELSGGLSVRATDEVCVYVKHPLFSEQPHQDLMEILKTSFCGRFAGRWDDVTTDAGAVWSLLEPGKREKRRTSS